MKTHLDIRPLTAMRGLAALWVLLHHLAGMAPPVVLPSLAANAWTGVDIFFVLSGFLMIAVYGSNARANLGRFYAKRICRIYPLHISVMLGLAAMVFGAPRLGLPLSNERFHDWSNFVVVLLLLQPYWPARDLWWNAPSWSASVELPCYAAFPFVAPWVCGLAAPVRVGLMIGATAAQIWLQYGSTEGVYVGLGSVVRGVSGFGLGMLLHGLVADWQPRPVRASIIESLAVLSILASCLAGLPCLVQGFGALLIGILSRDCGVWAWLLRSAVLVWLGRVSFSIYLLHEPLIVLLLKLMPPGGAAETVLTPIGHRIVLIAVVVAAAGVSYRLIEAPGQRLPDLVRIGLNPAKRRLTERHVLRPFFPATEPGHKTRDADG